MENGRRLMARPDFEAARKAAPDWVFEAIETIAALEYELERRP